MVRTRFARLTSLLVIVAALVLPTTAPGSVLSLGSQDDPPPSGTSSSKNDPQAAPAEAVQGASSSDSPAPATKNHGGVRAQTDPVGIALAASPSVGSKNYRTEPDSDVAPDLALTMPVPDQPVVIDTPFPPGEGISGKNGPAEATADDGLAAFEADVPAPNTKNGFRNEPAAGPAGFGVSMPAPAGSKNELETMNPGLAPVGSAGTLATMGSLLTCQSSGNLNWTTTSGTFGVVRKCTLTVPQSGWAYIATSASLAYSGAPSEALFEIGVDSTAGDGNIDRWVNVYADGSDGTDETMALSVLKPIGPGTHTFYLLAKRYAGTGTVLVYDPTLSVIYVPAASATALACGASGNVNWTTISGTFAVVRQCTLTVPQNGWVFVAADASMARSDNDYEAQFEMGIDSTAGDTSIDRWVNVYADAGDGTDRSVALSVLKNVTPGTHTFYFLAKRYGGTGTVLAYDPTLTAIYVPAPSATALACGASGNLNWTTTSSSFAVARQCALTVPQDGWVLVSADASLARSSGPYEAQFEIGIDTAAGDPNIDRWVDVHDDTGDGSDKSVALNVLRPVHAGAHTFYFLGKRYAGTGTVLAYDSTLTVVYIPAPSPTSLACQSSGNLNWTTTSGTFGVVRKCTLTVPQSGWAYIATSASLAYSGAPSEALFEIGVDSTAGDGNVDRWVNVYADGGDGTDETMALSVLKSIGPGTHTFYLLAKRHAGTGTVLVYDPTLSVIYVPAASATALACGASGNVNWTTTSGTFAVVRQCTLTVPQNGWVFVAADASMAWSDNDYEAQFEMGIDSTAGDLNIDRWVNVYADAGDGTDRSVALSVLKNVTPGTHIFYFLARRQGGTGTVLAYDPTLTAIYVPATSATVKSCGASGNLNWTTTSSSFAVARQCTLAVPEDSWMLISADASLAWSSGPYEAQFEVGIDSTAGNPNIDRWVDVHDDTYDGSDKSIALNVLRPVRAGAHTIYFLGRRYAGTGAVLAYDPTLTVIATGASYPHIFLPLALR